MACAAFSMRYDSPFPSCHLKKHTRYLLCRNFINFAISTIISPKGNGI